MAHELHDIPAAELANPRGGAATPRPLLPGLAAGSALAAVAGWASCCVLPMALAALGLFGVGASAMVFMATVRGPLTLVALSVLAFGWFSWFQTRRRCRTGVCEAPARMTTSLLVLGTVLTVAALMWQPYIEPIVLREIRSWPR